MIITMMIRYELINLNGLSCLRPRKKIKGGNIQMSNRFDGKVVLITGAGSGLGQASALQVAKEGAKLSLVDLNEESLEETKNKF